jgi:hypothetical protein
MFRRFISALTLTVFLVSTITSPVFALSQADKDAINLDTVWWKTITQGSGCSTSANLQGSTNQEIVFNFLVSKGLSKEIAAAFIGNMISRLTQRQ